MADVIKKVDRLVPTNERSQVFKSTDGGAGTVFLIEDSLGRPARRVLIEAAAAMTIRFNVYQMVYGTRKYTDDHWNQWNGEIRNLAQGTRIKDNTTVIHAIAADATFEIDGDIPVKDIEIVTAAGTFTITVM